MAFASGQETGMASSVTAPATIIIVDADPGSRKTLKAILGPDGFAIHEAGDPDEAMYLLNDISPDLILLDFKLTGKNGLEVAMEFKERVPGVPVLMITEGRDMRVIVQAIRRGIFDYLTKPLNANDLRVSISQALEEKRLKEEVRSLKGRLEGRISLMDKMGSSDKIQKLSRLLEKIAPSPFTVLIEGESGAGKELVARAIHDMSAVREGPFVAVDCGAIPETLFESELFGYMKGAFTGAASSKHGFFEAADKGTLFMDEVCNLAYASQQKLLRVIEERRVQRLGSTTSRPVNVRIIAATNRPLEGDVEAHLFRADLLYRLKEVSVRVPPLRERREDIYYLAQRFLDEFRERIDIRCRGFSGPALTALMHYSWPGNVRELRNVVRQVALTCEDGQTVQPGQLPFVDGVPVASPWPPLPAETPREAVAGGAPVKAPPPERAADAVELAGRSLAELVKEQTQELEKAVIVRVLEETGGNKLQAAKLLQIDYKTMHRKCKHLGIGGGAGKRKKAR